MSLERSLAPAEQHAYAVRLDSGAAIVGAVDQHGIDVVIDVYGPDGTRMTRLDSPNGTDGPEPIDVTALRSGTHTFVVHTLDPNAKPGTYVIRVDRLLAVAPNAQRLAKAAYPPALYALWEASLTDPRAVEKFITERKGKPALVDATPVNAAETRVTYAVEGDGDTERVFMNGGPEFGVLMRRFGKTNLFFGTQIVANDARFEYSFRALEVGHAGPNGEIEIARTVEYGPWLLQMPDAPAQPYVTAADDVPKGRIAAATIKSTALGEDRRVTVYTPPSYDGTTAANLLIVFDGVTYGGDVGRTPAEVPTPTILDNLIAQKQIGPTIAIMVWTMGKRNRDLTGSKPFADFVGTELVPWARSHYRIVPGPRNVIAAGSSFGGFAASYCAFAHPEAIGNVLSQSGSYWITKDWQNVRPPYPRDTGMMIDAFKLAKRLPIRFYLDVGRYDLGAAMLGSNRELRDVLQTKGYAVDYREFDGGHEYAAWRGTLSDGLIALLKA